MQLLDGKCRGMPNLFPLAEREKILQAGAIPYSTSVWVSCWRGCGICSGYEESLFLFVSSWRNDLCGSGSNTASPFIPVQVWFFH